MTNTRLSKVAEPSDELASEQKSAQRSRRGLAVNAAVTIGFLCVIAFTVDLAEAGRKLREIGPAPLALALALFAAQSIAAAWRWHALLGSVGARTRFARDFQIYMSAAVANVALLPQIGSLSVRAWLVVREGVGIGPAVSTLMLERLLVLASLGVAIVVGAVILRDVVADFATVWFVAIGIAGIVAVLIVSSVVMRLIAKRHPASDFAPIAQCARAPKRSAAIVLSSLFVVYSGFAAVAVIATSLDAEISWLLIFAIQPVVAILAALPISIGGWGVREGGMIVSLGMLGVSIENALAISVAAALAAIVATLALAGVVQIFNAAQRLRRTGGQAAFAARRPGSISA
jgi:uncharacterized membrane protein YbhN (UPF0104 family)